MSLRRRFLLAQLVVVGILAFLHIFFGENLDYYSTVWWWDIPMHMLGGLWAGFFAAWVFTLFKKHPKPIDCAMFALAVGVSWEVFEYVYGIGGSLFMSYWIDTIKDLCDDVIGGTVAGFLTLYIMEL